MQQVQRKTETVKNRILLYLSILMFFFILFECCVLIEGSEFYLGDYKLVANHLKIPLGILPGFFYFLGIQFALHIAYVLIIVWIAYLIGAALSLSASHIEKIGITLWGIGICWLLLANQYFFPNTKFSTLTYVFVKYGVLNFLLYGFSVLLAAAILVAIGGLVRKARWPAVLLGAMLFTGVSVFLYHKPPLIHSVATEARPNVFIIGVDAVRPDFLGYFGSYLNTAHFDRFLNHAAVFGEAMTPLARTYPSWMSVLTGKYPKHTGIRTDLSSQMNYDMTQTLPSILHKEGYETIFATDEVRFSNIDERMGFDRLVTPPIGFNDFLIGSLNDFPISNLLVNTPLGRYLFPHSYGNRAVYITYNPNTFLKLITPTLSEQRTKPLFLAIHFCLPHYPYSWSQLPHTTQYLHNYRSAIQRVDLQLYDFLKLLKKNKLLEHSIVVLISDHGEAIELSGDRATDPELFVPGKSNVTGQIPHFFPPSVKTEKVNQSAGHGTDVLGIPQYHSLLAFRYFGLKGQESNRVSGMVSLLDIKPTLLDVLKITGSSSDGQSLAVYVSGKKSVKTNAHDFFYESDFSPEAVRSVHPETRKLLFQGIDYFEIDPKTTRIIVKKAMVDLIVSSKQFADLYGTWVLALYPQNNRTMIPVLVNLETGAWSTDLQTEFAKHSPAQHMLSALKTFYGQDMTPIRNES